MSSFEQKKTVTVEFSTFSNLVNSSGNGGALYLESVFVIVSHCSIYGCEANFGGGIYVKNSEISVSYSSFNSNRCYTSSTDELGGNAICIDSSINANINNNNLLKCAPQDKSYGETTIVAHVKQFQASLLNISKCYGKSGGFLSVRLTEIDSQIIYINAVESHDYSMLEHLDYKANVRRSNFIRNTMDAFFLSYNVSCENCVFIGNSDKNTFNSIQFVNCYGSYPGHQSTDPNILTIQFPEYRFRASRKFRFRKCGTLIHFSLVSMFERLR